MVLVFTKAQHTDRTRSHMDKHFAFLLRQYLSLSNLIAVKAGCLHPKAKQIVRPPMGLCGGRGTSQPPWPATEGPVSIDLLLQHVLGAPRLREHAWNLWPWVEFALTQRESVVRRK